MSKGFLWFCQNNNETDYTKLSIELARTKNTTKKTEYVWWWMKAVFFKVSGWMISKY
jgi:hypothetical protein